MENTRGGKPGAAALAAMSLEDLMNVRIVTTASKFAQPIHEAPSAVVVLTADDIKTFGWRTLGDALTTLPGLYTSYDRNYAYLGARGYLRPGDYGSRFLILIDGRRTNDPLYDQTAIGTGFILDMDTIDRIEYVPGPGSSLYGANAFFGTINIITKDGKAYDGVETAAAWGSFGEKKARVSYGWHGEDNSDLVLSATAYERSGRDLYFAEFDTPDQNNGIANHLDYDRAVNLLLKAKYSDFTFSLMHMSRTKGVPTASYETAFNTRYFTEDAQSLASIKYARALSETLSVDGHLYAGRYEYEAESVPAWSAPQVNIDGSRATWYGIDVQATSTALKGHKIVVGANLQRDARKEQYNYYVEPYSSLLDDRRSADHTGIYIEDEITLPHDFILSAGARYDVISGAGGTFNPRVALIHQLAPQTTIKAIYGTAYRAPNAYEMYYSVEGEGGQLGNPDLKPERITTQELVLDQAFGHSTRATLSLFRYQIQDLISQDLSPDSGLYIYQNLDRANARGAELNVEHKWNGGAAVRASYSWQQARDGNTDAVLDNSPTTTAKLNLALPMYRHSVKLGTELRYISGRNTAPGQVPSYYLANLTVNLPKLIKNADVSLGAYNLFDKRYADPAGPGLSQQSISQEGRTFLLKITYRL